MALLGLLSLSEISAEGYLGLEVLAGFDKTIELNLVGASENHELITHIHLLESPHLGFYSKNPKQTPTTFSYFGIELEQQAFAPWWLGFYFGFGLEHRTLALDKPQKYRIDRAMPLLLSSISFSPIGYIALWTKLKTGHPIFFKEFFYYEIDSELRFDPFGEVMNPSGDSAFFSLSLRYRGTLIKKLISQEFTVAGKFTLLY